MSEMKVNAYFEPADNRVVELTDGERSQEVDFGSPSHITAISVSHGNDDYVIVRLRKVEDTKPFWSAKFFSGLNGQIFIQPIPSEPVRKVVVEVEPKEGTQITDSVIVNVSYIQG
ncbi:hypothetical protein [Thermococcus aciditolerans]|uniref:Uncharacterized protein n=1 Tax=Thermococcus aciditolerans TaxID=2598455 RepID=A0A5C0SJS8_9EURY|nr:hypothetical protein [Thermococcus aciditolerans]QEK14755.1 hypothetical protein FPV09_06205 [Thermococcus aciditolerans]